MNCLAFGFDLFCQPLFSTSKQAQTYRPINQHPHSPCFPMPEYISKMVREGYIIVKYLGSFYRTFLRTSIPTDTMEKKQRNRKKDHMKNERIFHFQSKEKCKRKKVRVPFCYTPLVFHPLISFASHFLPTVNNLVSMINPFSDSRQSSNHHQ